MYEVRILNDGNIWVVRLSDMAKAKYQIHGAPVYGSMNKLGLSESEVSALVDEAQQEWIDKYVHGKQ